MNFKPEERCLIGEVVIICKLLHVNLATSASAERSFSMARCLKTWLRSNMKQARFNNLAILNFHKKRADTMPLLEIANYFVKNLASLLKQVFSGNFYREEKPFVVNFVGSLSCSLRVIFTMFNLFDLVRTNTFI